MWKYGQKTVTHVHVDGPCFTKFTVTVPNEVKLVAPPSTKNGRIPTTLKQEDILRLELIKKDWIQIHDIHVSFVEI